MPRVVITGLGVVSPLGAAVHQFWAGLLSGKSATRVVTDEKISTLPCPAAAFVDRSSVKPLPAGEQRYLSFGGSMALQAAESALRDAAFDPTSNERSNSSGVAMGMGFVDMDRIIETNEKVIKKKRVSPYFVPSVLPNTPAGAISSRFKMFGPCFTPVLACASGAAAISSAFHAVRSGAADLMLAGAYDEVLSPLSLAGFASARALANGLPPESASRPFDISRCGLVPGEGAGALVLENLDVALSRNVKIYAEVLGCGSAFNSTGNISAPCSDGSTRSMLAALKDANLPPTSIDYINAHATSTKLGDAAELSAINGVFGNEVLISSCKGSLGHLLGAAGAVESVASAMACFTRKLPLSVNFSETEKPFDKMKILRDNHEFGRNVTILKNSLGFGGANVSIIFKSV